MAKVRAESLFAGIKQKQQLIVYASKFFVQAILTRMTCSGDAPLFCGIYGISNTEVDTKHIMIQVSQQLCFLCNYDHYVVQKNISY